MDLPIRGTLAASLAAACMVGAALPAAASAAPTTRTHAATAAGSNANCPWLNDSEPIETRVSQLMSQMTLADEIDLVEGHQSSNPPYVFYEPAIPGLCIPQLGEEDGPNGVGDGLTGVTQLPAGVTLAATFSDTLARQYGAVVGSEEWGKGAAVDLGPTINLDRDPRWGRSFEAYSEDPYLNGGLGSAEVDGLQATGELDQLKHYDDYDQETNRNTPQDDEVMTVRTAQEIYLKAFNMVVHQADPASIMCSYSSFSIIGSPDPSEQYACEDNYLENDVLKQDWNFPGFITSDYGALHDTIQGIESGTDQEQPEDTYFGQALETDIQNGTVPQSYLNSAVDRELTEMFRFNLFDAPPTGNTSSVVTTPAHVAVSTKVAQDGTTLLKNSGGTLPLAAKNGGSIAVIGPSAQASPTDGGGGSAQVVPSKTVTPLQGLESAVKSGTHLSYTQGLPTDASLPTISDITPAYAPTPFGGSYTGTLTAPETGTYVLAFTNPYPYYTATYLTLNGKQILDNPGTPPQSTYSVAVQLTKGTQYTIGLTGGSSQLGWATPSMLASDISAAVKAAKAAQTAVVVVSDDTETEAADRLKLALPSAQDELISKVAAANPHTVVVIDAGAPVTMPWLGSVSSVLDAFYPGETNGTALANVLFGAVNPSGHLPVTFPQNLSQVPASTPQQFPGVNGTVQFSEGLDIGYRWYDAKNIAPLFPFGYGLSYTTFGYSNLQVQAPSQPGADATVSATVTNTGSRAGSDVAQLYLADPSAAGEPPRQLAGYKRVTLGPGQSTQVKFKVTPQDEEWWDTSANGWSQSPGAYGVYVGDSSALADLPLQGSFTLATTAGSREVSVSAPSTMTPGSPSTVTVNLTASGTQTVPKATLAVQVPQGWTATPIGKASFTNVAPGTALTAQFSVTPAADSPNINATVHATAVLGPDLTREAGTSTAVG
jgi:beta-glucosidase